MFDFRASMKNGKWKMDDHFPFCIFHLLWKMKITVCTRTLHIEVYRACRASNHRASRLLAWSLRPASRCPRDESRPIHVRYTAVYRRRKTHRRQNTPATSLWNARRCLRWQYVNLTAPCDEYCHFTALPTLDARCNLIFSTNPMTSVSRRRHQ